MARRAGLAIHHEYLAVPSAARPAFLIEDAPASVEYFCGRVLTIPPGPVAEALLIEVALRVIQGIRPWAWMGAAVPGRMVVVERT
jgi:hypothetical protein